MGQAMNSVRIEIPPVLQPFAGNTAQLAVEARSVREALDRAGAGREPLRTRLLTPEGELRPYVNVFLGERNIRRLQGLDTPLNDGDVLVILPAVAGG